MDETERASRALRGRIGAHRLHATHDPRETTRAARQAFWSSFERRGRSRRSARARRARSTCQPRPSRALRPPRLSERSGTRRSINPSTTRLTAGSIPEDASHLIGQLHHSPLPGLGTERTSACLPPDRRNRTRNLAMDGASD